MMASSAQDGGQNDGHGFATVDGVIYKSARPYVVTPPYWMYQPDELHGIAGRVVISHIRKASNNTGRADEEAHPYHVTNRMGENLVFAHNGFIWGVQGEYNKDDPNTDSYRALKRLVHMINEDEFCNLTDELIVKWISTFAYGSVYVMFILYRDELIVVRGPRDRIMHFASFGNGYVFHTSAEILNPVLDTVLAVHGVESGKVWVMNEHAIIRVSPGQSEYHGHTFAPPTYTAYHNPPKTSPAPRESGSGGSSVGGLLLPAPAGTTRVSGVDGGGYVTRGGGAQFNGLAGEDDELHVTMGFANNAQQQRARREDTKRRTDVLTNVRAALNPLRMMAIGLFIARTFSLKTPKGALDATCILTMDESDIKGFYEMLPFINEGDDGRLTERQRQLAQLWNRLVPREMEVEALVKFDERHGGFYWERSDLSDDLMTQYIQSVVNSLHYANVA
jgi:hypothetical protein